MTERLRVKEIRDLLAAATYPYPKEYLFVLLDVYKAPIDFTPKPVHSNKGKFEGETILSSEYDTRIGKQTPGVRYIVGPEYTKVLPVKPVSTRHLKDVKLEPITGRLFGLTTEIKTDYCKGNVNGTCHH